MALLKSSSSSSSHHRPRGGSLLRFLAGCALAWAALSFLSHSYRRYSTDSGWPSLPFFRDATTPAHPRPSAADDEKELLTVADSVAHCPGYEAHNVDIGAFGMTADLRLAGPACNVFGEDIADLKMLVEFQTDKRIHVKIYDAGQDVYQVPESVLPIPPHEKSKRPDIFFSITEKPFSFAVTRSSTNEVLFNTSGTHLVFESQFVRLRTSLPEDPNLYGLGSHHDSFHLHTTAYKRSLWNADTYFLPPRFNSYGSHPVYLDHRSSGNTHGVFLRSSSGMEVNIHSTPKDGQYLEYVLLGGVLDFYFLLGPTPAEVSAQYAAVVGHPAMHPYWALGVHQCKYGYWDVNMLAEVAANYSAAQIPMDVLWSDIDSMDDRRDFTLDPSHFPMRKMRLLIDTLHARGQRFVTMVDSGVPRLDYPPFQRGHEKDVFLKAEDGSEHLGVQWPGVVVWPDWVAPNTQEWWTDEIVRWFDPATGMDVDGLWNDMNEASNFCPDASCDPVELARQGRNMPPAKHEPRPNTGRPIPGFPPEFQPDYKGDEHAAHSASHIDEDKVVAEDVYIHDAHWPPAQDQAHHEIELKKRSQEASSHTQAPAVKGGEMKGLPGRNLLSPPYTVRNFRGPTLSGHTIFTNITNHDGTAQYDTHNFWGTLMAFATRTALQTRRPTLRPFVLTRSTYSGVGRAAAHWFGDNVSSWAHMRLSIAQMLSASVTQAMPLAGSDVCGFHDDTTPELCARWAMVGAFQPFFRNHADLYQIHQEFYQWEVTTLAARKGIAARYRLLDYMYTALEGQTRGRGEPLAKPLWFAYPRDEKTFGIETQWLLGDAVLVSPVLEEGRFDVAAYFPDDIFYDFWTLEPLRGEGKMVTFQDVGYDDMPVHFRGGNIVPLRASGTANTTAQLRGEGFVVVVAPGLDGKAKGRLYLDDGESLDPGKNLTRVEFAWDGKAFKAEAEDGAWGYETAVGVEAVVLLGQTRALGIKGSKFDEQTGAVTVPGPWSLRKPFGFALPS